MERIKVVWTLFILLLSKALACGQAEALRTYGDQVYDFSQVLNSTLAWTGKYKLTGKILQHMPEGSLLNVQTGVVPAHWGLNEPLAHAESMQGSASLLRVIVADRMVEIGNISSGQLMAYSPEMRRLFQWKPEEPTFTLVYIRKLPMNAPDQISMLVLPSSPFRYRTEKEQFNTVPSFLFTDEATEIKPSVTNIWKVTAKGMIATPTKSPSSFSQKPIARVQQTTNRPGGLLNPSLKVRIIP